jgi:hypothetical protein
MNAHGSIIDDSILTAQPISVTGARKLGVRNQQREDREKVVTVRTYLQAASGGEVAEVDEVGGGEADGEAEAEAEDAAHEAHRLSSPSTSLPRSRMPAGAAPRHATTPGTAATAAAWGVGSRPRARAEVAGWFWVWWCGFVVAAGAPRRMRRTNRGGGGNNWSSIVLDY